jgi:hypothetical protein
MTQNNTITVTDWRGEDKQVTQEDYVTQWRDHASELIHLVDYRDQSTRDQYESIMEQVETLATQRFKNIHTQEKV